MKNRRLRKGRCLICLLAAFIIFNFSGSFLPAKADNIEQDMAPIYVSEGDTLWSIVQENYDYSGDIRAAINQVKTINGLTDSTINVGDVIYVPKTAR